MRAVTLVALLLTGPAAGAVQTDRPACAEWTACRDMAIEAAGRKEYETSHDLAWRAIQTGPPRHGELMLLLARTQSLSGRPLDALVMLRRLADMGVLAEEALTSEDFQRVRALPGWPEVEARIKKVAPPAPSQPAAASSGANIAPPRSTPASRNPSIEEALRLPSWSAFPSDMAFDVVSKRFLFGDLANRKVVAISAPAGTPIDLVRAQSAGFYDVQAIEIDTLRGDLWVASAEAGASSGSPGGAESRAALHKLQLVSGRPLTTIQLPAIDRPVRFCDLAVTRTGTVMALDCAGRRLWRHVAGSGTVRLLMELNDVEPTSLGLADDDRAFVAHRTGVDRIDLTSKARRRVQQGGGIKLAGITHLRWHANSLMVVQQTGEHRRQLARVRLNRAGEQAIGIDVLDHSLPGASSIATVAGEYLYYVVRAPGAAAAIGETVVRRVNLRKRAGG